MNSFAGKLLITRLYYLCTLVSRRPLCEITINVREVEKSGEHTECC